MPDPIKAEIDDMLNPLLAVFETELETIIRNGALGAYLKGSAQMISYGKTLKGIPVAFEGPPQRQAIAYASKRAARLVTKINQETKDRLAEIISNGIKEKRGIPGLARDIRNEFKTWQRSEEMPVYRSKLIARTETNTALSTGSFERGSAMGIKYKRWLTVGDDKVRPEHQENERAGVIPWDEEFPDGSLHPPGADPFNCRCTLLPSLGPISESFREGGSGSGNFGHAGRPGQVGGSGGSGVGIKPSPEKPKTAVGNHRDTWSPTMSSQEAEEWASDSSYKETIYHGTTKSAEIEEGGFGRQFIGGTTGNAGMLGEGFYFSPDIESANQYGNKTLKVKVNVKNVCPPSEFTKTAKEINYNKLYSQDSMKAPITMRKALQAKGYDAVQFKWSIKEVCVFNSRDIVVVKD